MGEQVDADRKVDTISLISIERDRQVQDLGYSFAHDDEHDDGSLALAAASYAAASRGTPIFMLDEYEPPYRFSITDVFPWSDEADKRIRDESTDERWVTEPNTEQRIRLLVKAAALIVAEIDRLRRSEQGA